MDKKEYTEYLANLVDLEIDLEREDLSELLYAFFQCFMPYGKDVEKVFAPLQFGSELYSRLLPVYKATEAHALQLFKEDLSPGYFCPVPVSNPDELLKQGRQYIANLKEFATFIEDFELVELLNKITEVVLAEEEPTDAESEINDYLYDAISDWALEIQDEENLISVLREAYYSINCDYYLSYYFQYPVIKNKPQVDFLEPYFRIWELGYYCKFTDSQLIIYK